jgi:hypothetical protein
VTPRVLDPEPDQAEDVLVVELGRGWSLIVTEGAAIVVHDDCRGGLALTPGDA